MTLYINRLIKAVLYTGLSLTYCFMFGTMKEALLHWMNTSDISLGWMNVFYIFGIVPILFFVKGMFFFCTLHVKKHPVYENGWKFHLTTGAPIDGATPNSNIDRISKYRDSLLSSKTNSDGADEYMKTAWIDGLKSNRGKRTNDVTNYIDSKLASMDNSTGYKWLKDKAK